MFQSLNTPSGLSQLSLFHRLNTARSRIAPIAIDVVASGHRMLLADMPLVLILLVLLARFASSLAIITKILAKEI